MSATSQGLKALSKWGAASGPGEEMTYVTKRKTVARPP